jgi:hypothetical protein
MTRWEYLFKPINVHDLDSIEFDMKRLGQEGWELVTVIPAAERKWPQATEMLQYCHWAMPLAVLAAVWIGAAIGLVVVTLCYVGGRT